MENLTHADIMPNGFLHYEQEQLPEITKELIEIANKRQYTAQDITIATAILKASKQLWTESNAQAYLPATLGAILYAGQILGARAERAKHHSANE